MKQKRLKNFIAFTLSEMMVVLLIISVLSAVTLPKILTKKSTKSINTDSVWQYDYTYTYGNYFKGDNDDTQVLIGQDIKGMTADFRTGLNSYGNTVVRLARPNVLEDVNAGVTQNRADIAFYDSAGTYTGKIAADIYENLVIGKNFGRLAANEDPPVNNVFIGIDTSTNEQVISQTDVSGAFANTIIGIDSMRNSSILNTEDFNPSGNVVIGNGINNITLGGHNVIIGNGASSGSNETAFSNAVSIGNDAGSGNKDLSDSISIGYHSNRHADGTAILNTKSINIGAQAGFIKTPSDSSDSNKEINIGNNASGNATGTAAYGINIGSNARANGGSGEGSINIGSNAANNATSEYSVSIGHKAGSDSSEDYFVNIGREAGNNASSYDVNIGSYTGYNSGGRAVNIGHYAGYRSSGSDSINIGNKAGYNSSGDYKVNIGNEANSESSGERQVVIGCQGLKLEASYRMCIGGKYPLKTDTLMSDDGNNVAWSSKTNSNLSAATFISTSGILGSSEVAFDKTNIWLAATYVVSKNASMYKFSDRTLKENIRKTQYGIDKFRKIQVREFNMKDSKIPKIGVIAQELMQEYPYAVTETTHPTTGAKILTVSPDWIIFSMVQALKDVDAMALNLKKILDKNKVLLAKQVKKVDLLQQKLDKLSNNNKLLQAQLKEIDEMLK